MAFKMYEYDFTELAEADIDDILFYITNELCNPKAATDFADELEKRLDDICKSPKNGRLVVNEFLKREDVTLVPDPITEILQILQNCCS